MTEPRASAGSPGGASPSGATSPGEVADDEVADDEATRPAAADGQPTAGPTPGQEPGAAPSPVPSPGDVPGASLPAVSTGQGPSPDTGIEQGEKADGSDATVASAGAFVALAVPGHPDGEVDTGSR